MAKITGLGGIFIKSRDPQALGRWYRDHLGFPYKEGEGACFLWKDDPQADEAMTVFNVFAQDTKYFNPSTSSFMLNFFLSVSAKEICHFLLVSFLIFILNYFLFTFYI